MSNIAIRVDGVNKSFKLPHEKQNSVKGIFVNLFRRKKSFEKQQVLKNVRFEIRKGEFFGIVGRNGSGKSTLLKLLAGIYEPDTGHIQTEGKLTPFIELGVGFNPNLTGRENVFLNGALLGFNRKEMLGMYEEIVAFAGLERFMDQKLKNYSSGMQVRLAFSIAIKAESEILLIDEVLAVGDAVFQEKCYNYFKELKRKKKTVVFVSHDAAALREYCTNGIFINEGVIKDKGPISRIVNNYIDSLNNAEEDAVKETEGKLSAKKRWGTGGIRVIKAETLDSSRKTNHTFTDKEGTLIIKVKYAAVNSHTEPIFGITISDAAGCTIFQSNTQWSNVKTFALAPNKSVTVEWEIPNIFNSGDYSVAPAVADRGGAVMLDWREDFTRFKVRKLLKSSAMANVEHKIKLKEG